jgi:hypothetical protein
MKEVDNGLREMKPEELRVGMKYLLLGILLPTIIVYIFLPSSIYIGGIHIFGWGQALLSWVIVVTAVLYHNKMESIKNDKRR